MIIVVDSREQNPYDLACINLPIAVEVATFSAGDYYLKGFKSQIYTRHQIDDA